MHIPLGLFLLSFTLIAAVDEPAPGLRMLAGKVALGE